MRVRIGLLVAAAAALALSACSSSGGGRSGAGWFEVRPLIMPGQHTTQARTDPFGSLHVPATERAYAALGSKQRAALRDALRGVDCAHPPTLPGGAVRVACDASSDVLLLGAPIFTGNDVEKATPVPPTASDAQWSLDLALNSTAADKLHRWTTKYHVQSQVGAYNDVQTSAKPPCAAATSTPCSAFLAYVSHDDVVTVPVTFAPAQSFVTVFGDFNEQSASRLARKITG